MLETDDGKTQLSPGMCAGFRAGTGNGHHLLNETSEYVVYLEVGDRSLGDEGTYPDDDLKAALVKVNGSSPTRTDRRTKTAMAELLTRRFSKRVCFCAGK